MQAKKRWLWVLLVVFTFGAVCAWLSRNSVELPFADRFYAKPTAAAQSDKKILISTSKPALTVQVVRPELVDWPVELSAGGDILPWQEASVGTQVNGLRLVDVHANIGDWVKKGQVLASFATDVPETELLQARANYESAKTNADRARSLQNTNALSQQQIDQYLTQEKVTAANLEMTEIRYRHTRLLAPDDGVVSASSATVGAVVGVGQELFRLIRKGRLEWRAEVASQEIARIKVGGTVMVTAVSDVVVPGRARAIAPSADVRTRNILVYVDIPNRTGIVAGMFATGVFQLGMQKGLRLPLAAVLLRDGFSYVFVVGTDNKVILRKVQVGRYQGDQAEILAGLDVGEPVVASGVGFLRDGDTVRVVQ